MDLLSAILVHGRRFNLTIGEQKIFSYELKNVSALTWSIVGYKDNKN